VQSTLRFDGERRLDITQYAISATVSHVRASGWSLRASIGSVLDGSLEEGARTHDIGPGIVATATVARQWLVRGFFLTGSLGVGASRITTVEAGMARQSLVAIDLIRAGAMAGRTFGVASPYLLARGFGGPVLWRLDGMDTTGTDTHHFQLGAGVSVAASSGLSLLLDVAALGERSASLGMAYRLR
jgi:hypothetical protein